MQSCGLPTARLGSESVLSPTSTDLSFQTPRDPRPPPGAIGVANPPAGHSPPLISLNFNLPGLRAEGPEPGKLTCNP